MTYNHTIDETIKILECLKHKNAAEYVRSFCEEQDVPLTSKMSLNSLFIWASIEQGDEFGETNITK